MPLGLIFVLLAACCNKLCPEAIIVFPGSYSYERFHSDRLIANKYRLEPTWDRKKLERIGDMTTCKTNCRVFISYSNAKEVALGLKYGIKVQAPWILPLDYVPEKNYKAYLGWRESRAGVPFEVRFTDRQGWIVSPLRDVGFYEV
ncbi:MAG: hypothetical protein HY779_04285 [Rubrobacteridae bacterium]|nr:hypothetical protein [Rubrobacteridae bacterium]